MNEFGNRLKEAIKKSGFSQKEIARLLNIPEQSLSRIIKGKNEPGIFKVSALAKLLGVSVDWLLTGKEPKSQNQVFHLSLHHLKGGHYNNVVNTGIMVNEPARELDLNMPPDITDNEISILLNKYSRLSRKSRQMIQKMLDLYLEEEK